MPTHGAFPTIKPGDCHSSEETLLLGFQTSGSKSYQHVCKCWAGRFTPTRRGLSR